jgi:DNA (cytosine-5)-methyltransferase 1
MKTFIEVCSGCGGLSSGLIQSGFTPILLNEKNKLCCETLIKNHPNVMIDNNDMSKLDAKVYKGQVDLLAGGVPCQSYSQAGSRKGLDDPRGQLIFDFNRILKECEPKMFLIENVKGLLNHKKGETFTSIKDLLSNQGLYNVYHKVLNAYDYEVPQKRERIFIVGVRRDINKVYQFPQKSDNHKVLQDILLDVPDSDGAQYSDYKKSFMELIPPGGCWIDLPEDKQLEYMGQRMLDSGGGKRGVLRRLALDEPSLTILTTPTQKQTERCHPTEIRPFTVRESARIQTFSDDFQFCGGLATQYKQIGNAVPVRLAYFVGRSILECLE